MATSEAEKVDHLQSAYRLSYHCARSIVLTLKDRGLVDDPIIWDGITASLKALHIGNIPVLKATDYASAWAYAIGFAIRDRGRSL